MPLATKEQTDLSNDSILKLIEIRSKLRFVEYFARTIGDSADEVYEIEPDVMSGLSDIMRECIAALRIVESRLDTNQTAVRINRSAL